MLDHGLRELLALAIFLGTYLGLAVGGLPGLRVDRAGIAIIGAALMLVTSVVAWEQAVAAVDAHTLVLLFGMMVVVANLRLSGFFTLVADVVVQRATTPVGLLAAVVVAAGILSALFVNDVVCVVLSPLILGLTRRLGLPPVPYLIALATASNVGSLATLTGNPQNMLVGSFSGIGYRAFLWREAPVALLGLGLVFAIVRLVYRDALRTPMDRANLRRRSRVHYPLMIKTGIAVGVMLVAFLAGVPIALVAIAGAAYTLLTRRVKPEKVYAEVDWRLLVLFTGLFVVIRGVETSGLAGDLLAAAGAAGLHRPAVLTVVAAAVSNLVSNVPAVLLFRSVIPTFGEPDRARLVLAMATTLAGNLTLLGSVANLIVVEAARSARVEVGFLEYCRVGVPLTIATLLLGWALLVLLPV